MTAVRGIDISHHNATADLDVAHAAGYRFVYLKATQGTGFKDPMFDDRVRAAHAAGVHVGAYLFLEPDQDVNAQVAHFIDVAGDLELIPALDHETHSAHGADATNVAAVAAAHLLEDHYGEPPVLYCDRSFISEGLCAGLGRCPLWIADYSGGIPNVSSSGRNENARAVAADAFEAALAGKPHTVPRAGASPHIPKGPWSTYAIWQTGQANVPGVAGGDGPGTDVNVAPDLDAFTRHTAPPNPTPVPPATQEDPMLVIRAKGRIAAIVDSAGVGHPISSAKWSAVNHTADKGASVEIVTLDAVADWDAYMPDTARTVAEARKLALEAYDPFTHPDTGEDLPDRSAFYPVKTVTVNNNSFGG